jgi:ComF family protein
MALALASSVKAIGGTLLDLLYPPRCGGCNEAGAGWWCPACAAKTHPFDAAQGLRQIDLPGGGTLAVVSAALFAAPLREGIHRFKYESQPQLAEAFGRMMSEAWLAAGAQADAWVPVPLHASRRRERGYNQSELLARVMSRHTQVPMRNWLKRIRRTEQQAHLGAQARVANVKDAFVADAGVNEKQIALVDDVLTTGATLAECALVLKAAGAAHVCAVTLARAGA